MRIAFLLSTVYGMGGIIRSSVNLANHLAGQGHQVEIINAFRASTDPHFDIDPRVTVSDLVDLRDEDPRGATGKRRALPSQIIPEDDLIFPDTSAETDHQFKRVLGRLNADVLLSTRPGLNIASAMLAHRRVVKVGIEHTNLSYHREGLLPHLKTWYPRLDAFVTLSDEEQAAYRQFLGSDGLPMHTIGNGIPDIRYPRSRGDNPIIVAVGRLAVVKGYDRLIHAFAQVAAKRPDWQLRFYGGGSQENKLKRLTDELGLYNNIHFMGRTNDVEGAFAKASIHAMSSHSEGYPMTIAEAMACGVPTVSFDCPRGPRQMIQHDHNGILVPNDDVDALATELLKLIEDDQHRHHLATNALQSSADFKMTRIGAIWEDLLTGLVTRRKR